MLQISKQITLKCVCVYIILESQQSSLKFFKEREKTSKKNIFHDYNFWLKYVIKWDCIFRNFLLFSLHWANKRIYSVFRKISTCQYGHFNNLWQSRNEYKNSELLFTEKPVLFIWLLLYKHYFENDTDFVRYLHATVLCVSLIFHPLLMLPSWSASNSRIWPQKEKHS